MKIYLLILVFVINIQAYSQVGQDRFVYATCDMNAGNYFYADFGVTYLFRGKYSLGIEYSSTISNPKSKPSDYAGGLASAAVFGLDGSHDEMESLQILGGRYFSINQQKTIRFNLQGGMMFSRLTMPVNWTKFEDSGGIQIGRNYDFDYDRNQTIGLVINPKFEFAFTRVFGLSASPQFIWNKQQVYYGIGIGYMLGVLRSSKQKGDDRFQPSP